MSAYEALAQCYDLLTADVPYPLWADYLQQHFHRWGLPGTTVLDLACGTGSLTWELAARGYEMIGVDRSPDMLAQAVAKENPSVPIPPLFLCQSMDQLDLYGTIDACVSCLDSVNYITDPQTLQQAFQRVYLFLAPGGLFLFDVHTPSKLQALDGQVFLDETPEIYCVWRTEYHPHSQLCHYYVDLFQRDPSTPLWRRREEHHIQRAYSPETLTQMLDQAGFQDIQQYQHLEMTPPSPEGERILFSARKNPNLTTQIK